MSDKTENHTIKLLQEMRQEINARFNEVNERFDQIDRRFDEVYERFDGVDARIDGVTHIVTLMASHSNNLDERVERLEEVVKAE
jgi:archaellum component FlaC